MATTFPNFPILPAELRLKVYKHAHFPRILQLGVRGGAPFPYLRDTPTSSNVRNKAFSPVRTTPPALFHVCHESRELCLATYVPFAYAYIHPRLDTLYISKQAGASMFENIAGIGGRAVPPLYPISLLERVAVEFDFEDLPERLMTEGGQIRDANGTVEVSPVMDYYIQTFAKFGPPKEILLVRGAQGVYSQHSLSITGWKRLRIIDGIQSIDLEPWQLARLVEYAETFLSVYKATNIWLQWRMPSLRIVGVKQEREIVMWKNQDAKALQRGRELAKEWKAKTALLAERDAFSLENMKRALVRAGVVANGSRSIPDLTWKAGCKKVVH